MKNVDWSEKKQGRRDRGNKHSQDLWDSFVIWLKDTPTSKWKRSSQPNFYEHIYFSSEFDLIELFHWMCPFVLF